MKTAGPLGPGAVKGLPAPVKSNGLLRLRISEIAPGRGWGIASTPVGLPALCVSLAALSSSNIGRTWPRVDAPMRRTPLVATIFGFVVLSAIAIAMVRRSMTSEALEAPEPPADNTRSIVEVLSDNLVEPGDPSVRIVFLSHEVVRDRDRLHFALINPSDAPIYYSGYTPTSHGPNLPLGQISPFYDAEFRAGNGWKKKLIVGCGNGMGRMRILPGQGARFVVTELPEERPVRISVWYSRIFEVQRAAPDANVELAQFIWSPAGQTDAPRPASP